MKVLVVGGGGREHTLVWKLAQCSRIDQIYCAPGNAGISQQAVCIDIGAEDIPALLNFARREKIDLTIVGPEAPLVKGIVDEFRREGLRIFGPNKKAAMIEGSKVLAKELMRKYGIPTADFQVFSSPREAIEYIRRKGVPLVVKADGLAAGKGVIVSKTMEEAEGAIQKIMVERVFGDAGSRVIVEDCLEGEEASVLVFTDGKSILPMASSQDHKPIYDEDRGPNTGGMGAYSPAPVVSGAVLERVIKEIMEPAIRGMREEGIGFQGVLYGGLMVTEEEPKVLEFNVRFGDPETQAILPRLKTDLVEVLESSMDESLDEVNLEWRDEAAVCVVLASGGYPGKYEKGKEIRGLGEAAAMKDVFVFHAGTREEGGRVLTNGGRVLGVTALGRDIEEAIGRAYKAVEKIHFDKMYYRRDIGQKALKRVGEREG